MLRKRGESYKEPLRKGPLVGFTYSKMKVPLWGMTSYSKEKGPLFPLSLRREEGKKVKLQNGFDVSFSLTD